MHAVPGCDGVSVLTCMYVCMIVQISHKLHAPLCLESMHACSCISEAYL